MVDAIITWKDGKTTVEDAANLPYIRKSAGGMGWLYFNPNTSKYEQYRSINVIPEEIKQRVLTRSASIAERKKSREATEKLPAHLRLHRIYGS